MIAKCTESQLSSKCGIKQCSMEYLVVPLCFSHCSQRTLSMSALTMSDSFWYAGCVFMKVDGEHSFIYRCNTIILLDMQDVVASVSICTSIRFPYSPISYTATTILHVMDYLKWMPLWHVYNLHLYHTAMLDTMHCDTIPKNIVNTGKSTQVWRPAHYPDIDIYILYHLCAGCIDKISKISIAIYQGPTWHMAPSLECCNTCCG